MELTPLNLYEYPKVLFDLEQEIAQKTRLKADLEAQRLTITESAKKQIADDNTIILDGDRVVRKYKSAAAITAAVESICIQSESYRDLDLKILELKFEISSLRAMHALRRREFRLLENENMVSGATIFPSYLLR